MKRFIPITLTAAALLWLVSVVAAPVSLQVDDTTGEVLSPLVADATSNKTIAVFEIPMGYPVPMFDFQANSSPTDQLPRDFELKIYRETQTATETSVLTANKVYWYHSPDNSDAGQVIPTGLPDGYYMGASGGTSDVLTKRLYKIRHTTYTSLSAHQSSSFIFTGVVIFVETANTDFERLENCHAMFCRYSATDSEAVDPNTGGRRWTPIQPSAWVSEIPAFIQ